MAGIVEKFKPGDPYTCTVSAASSTVTAGAAVEPRTDTAEIVTGTVAAKNALTWTAVEGGHHGNEVSIEYTLPGAGNATTDVTVSGSAITFALATDGNNVSTETADGIKTALGNTPAAVALVGAADYSTSDGSGLVTRMGKTFLRGGADDRNVQLASANTPAATGVALRGGAAGEKCTVVSYGVVPMTASGTILASQLVAVAAAGKVAAIASGWNSAQEATLVTGTVGAKNAILYTAVDAGAAGNGISITYTNPGAGNATVDITVAGNDIDVALSTDGGGIATATADDVKTALAASAAASALVTAADYSTSDGSGLVDAATAENLSGGYDPGEPAYIAIGRALSGARNAEQVLVLLSF